MRRRGDASCVGAYPTWEVAMREALRINAVCQEKFGTGGNWRYRVRRRRAGDPAWWAPRWRVYTPTGRIPKS